MDGTPTIDEDIAALLEAIGEHPCCRKYPDIERLTGESPEDQARAPDPPVPAGANRHTQNESGGG